MSIATTTIVKRLNSLTGRCEALQCKLAGRKDRSDNHRRLYEAVADAKKRLLDALRLAESAAP